MHHHSHTWGSHGSNATLYNMCVNCSLIRRKATASGNPKDKMKPVIMAVFKMRISYVIFICNQQAHTATCGLKYWKRVIFIKEYAYIRVSSKDQQECRQVIAMESRGISPERIFLEKLSGKDTKRPMLQLLMNTVKKRETRWR